MDDPSDVEIYGAQLTRGRGAPPRQVVLASQRHRLLQAVAHGAGTKGIVELTVGDVCGTARVGRRAFYEQFEDKADCYLAAYRLNAGLLLDRCRAATLAPGNPSERLLHIFDAYMSTLAANPVYARAFFIEPLRAGDAAVEERDRIHSEFASITREAYERARAQHPSLVEQPDFVFVGLIGAINELISRELRRGDEADIPSLGEAIMQLVHSLLGIRAQARDLLDGLTEARS